MVEAFQLVYEVPPPNIFCAVVLLFVRPALVKQKRLIPGTTPRPLVVGVAYMAFPSYSIAPLVCEVRMVVLDELNASGATLVVPAARDNSLFVRVCESVVPTPAPAVFPTPPAGNVAPTVPSNISAIMFPDYDQLPIKTDVPGTPRSPIGHMVMFDPASSVTAANVDEVVVYCGIKVPVPLKVTTPEKLPWYCAAALVIDGNTTVAAVVVAAPCPALEAANPVTVLFVVA